MTAHELRAALQARGCEVKEVERLDAPSPLPPPESFMDALDRIYSSFPTYRLLDETMRRKLRVLLAREARRWVEEDVPAGRTADPTRARFSLPYRLIASKDRARNEHGHFAKARQRCFGLAG